MVCPALQLQITEEARPCGGVGLRQGRQIRPRQIAFHGHDVGCRHASVFGVAAVDGAAHPAQDRGDFAADRKLTAWA